MDATLIILLPSLQKQPVAADREGGAYGIGEV
jgi:hypothetical protein